MSENEKWAAYYAARARKANSWDHYLASIVGCIRQLESPENRASDHTSARSHGSPCSAEVCVPTNQVSSKASIASVTVTFQLC
jgi:hypothetical protein